MSVRVQAACLVLALLGASPTAHAQTPKPVASAKPAAPASAPLALVLGLGDSKLDPEAIRRAVEVELARPVAISSSAPANDAFTGVAEPSLTVTVHADRTVTVSYHAANGVTRTRSIGLPQDDARSPEMIALLSGNLSRDEAAELLAGLAARAGSSPDANAPAAPEVVTDRAKKADPQAAGGSKAEKRQDPAPAKARAENDLLTTPYPLVDLTLAHPIGLVPNSERYVINGELGLVYSRIGELRGVGMNVMVLRTEQNVYGWSYATFYNRTGGTVFGVTGSGLLATYGNLEGCAISGIANVGQNFGGCELSGIANRARDGRGVQISGLANIAQKFAGIQLSGIANVAGDIAGAQIGLINVAGNVSGMQVGLVNVAKHVDGASIGLVSIAGNGRAQPLIWASTFMPLNAGAKFTVGYFYTQLSGGYQPSKHIYSYELGLGAHLPLGRFFVEPGVHYSEQRDAEQSFSHELSEHVHYQVTAGLDLRAVSPFVGAALLQRFAHALDAPESSTDTFEAFGGLAFF